jgi:phosphatidylserine/phosphatidylglycerophosphate/cardiolipin synthase-like enzyme
MDTSTYKNEQIARDALYVLASHINPDNSILVKKYIDKKIDGDKLISDSKLNRNSVRAIDNSIDTLNIFKVNIKESVELAVIFEPRKIEVNYTLPEEIFTMGKLQSSIIKSMREIIRSTERELTIVSPFLNKEGIGLLRESFQSLPEEAEVKLLTRYITYGDTEFNREAASLLEEMTPKLRVFEYRDSWDFDSHAKVVFSETTMYIGSANLTDKGMKDNLEIGFKAEVNHLEEVEHTVSKVFNSTNCVEFTGKL